MNSIALEKKNKLFTIVADGDGYVTLNVNGVTTKVKLAPSGPSRKVPQKYTFNINWMSKPSKAPTTTTKSAMTLRSADGGDPSVEAITTQGPCDIPPCDLLSDLDQYQP